MMLIISEISCFQAKKFVESAPQVVKNDIGKDEADELKSKLEAVGATVEIEWSCVKSFINGAHYLYIMTIKGSTLSDRWVEAVILSLNLCVCFQILTALPIDTRSFDKGFAFVSYAMILYSSNFRVILLIAQSHNRPFLDLILW